MSFTFGPVASRRFGVSLGIDLSPDQKQCNFDCLYCELKGAKAIQTYTDIAPVDAIVAEVTTKIDDPKIDVITITANGEPSLYPHLDQLIDRLLLIRGDKKLMILSNGSTISDSSVQKALAKLDIVKLSLDCATQKCFAKLDRAKGIEVAKIIDGMISFRAKFAGFLVIEILVVKGFNDTKEEFEALNHALDQIQANRIDIGTIERPPAYKVEAVSSENLQTLAQIITAKNVNIIAPKYAKIAQTLDETALLELIARRSLSEEEAVAILDQPSQKRLAELLLQDKIKLKKVGEKSFFSN